MQINSRVKKRQHPKQHFGSKLWLAYYIHNDVLCRNYLKMWISNKNPNILLTHMFQTWELIILEHNFVIYLFYTMNKINHQAENIEVSYFKFTYKRYAYLKVYK